LPVSVGMVLQPIHDLEAVVVDDLGQCHRASVLGIPRDDGLWDGYIEFRCEEGGVHVTPRETTQPDAGGLFSWASRLSEVYLEGALARATDRASGLLGFRRPAAVT